MAALNCFHICVVLYFVLCCGNGNRNLLTEEDGSNWAEEQAGAKQKPSPKPAPDPIPRFGGVVYSGWYAYEDGENNIDEYDTEQIIEISPIVMYGIVTAISALLLMNIAFLIYINFCKSQNVHKYSKANITTSSDDDI